MPRARSVLIVEDEPLIAMMLEDFLDSLGHTVVATTDNAAAALEAIDAGGFDLAILDVNLRDGEPSWAVADALAERGIAILFATGGHVEPPPERYRDAPVLAKPFARDSVEQALEGLS